MGAIHYWRDYLKCDNNTINTSDHILFFYINNSINNICYTKCYFFNNTTEILRFVKYIVLPSFTYSNIKSDKDEIIIEAVNYREMLNFFTISDNYYSKELIKKYSYFFNKLEELEYGDFNEKEFNIICSELSKYFSINNKVITCVRYYDNLKKFKSELNDCISIHDNRLEVVNMMECIEKTSFV